MRLVLILLLGILLNAFKVLGQHSFPSLKTYSYYKLEGSTKVPFLFLEENYKGKVLVQAKMDTLNLKLKDSQIMFLKLFSTINNRDSIYIRYLENKDHKLLNYVRKEILEFTTKLKFKKDSLCRAESLLYTIPIIVYPKNRKVNLHFKGKRKSLKLDYSINHDKLIIRTINSDIIIEKQELLKMLSADYLHNESLINIILKANDFVDLTDFKHSNILLLKMYLLKLIYDLKANIFIRDNRVSKVTFRNNSYKQAYGSSYYEVIEPKTKRIIISVPNKFGE